VGEGAAGGGWGGEGEGERVRGGLLCSAEKRGIKRAEWAAGESRGSPHKSRRAAQCERRGVTVE
jgi:hypothetical protein